MQGPTRWERILTATKARPAKGGRRVIHRDREDEEETRKKEEG
jgi:hypothetical protein